MARICLVGFQPSALGAIARALGPGHSCHAYVLGKDALRAAKVSAPDLVVSDARMFDMKATTLVQKLHELLKHRCPPVLFTASRDEVEGQLPPSLRACFVPRPFRNAELIAAIDSLLGARALFERSGFIVLANRIRSRRAASDQAATRPDARCAGAGAWRITCSHAPSHAAPYAASPAGPHAHRP